MRRAHGFHAARDREAPHAWAPHARVPPGPDTAAAGPPVVPPDLTSLPWPPGLSIAVFAVAGALTVLGSIRLVTLGDTLADRTGWGEAFFGAVFFGLATSLSAS